MATPKFARDFLDFVNASPTPYHAVHWATERLQQHGFSRVQEQDDWTSTLQPGGKYYLTRNHSSIVAFAIGCKWKPGNPIAMVCAHTDSPCLRVKPESKRTVAGFLQVGVETYGGGMWHTWFDRDLSIAGFAIIKDRDGKFARKLVKIDRPILRIPTLAVHLDRNPIFNPNVETEMLPIAGLIATQLNKICTEPVETGSNHATTSQETRLHELKKMADRHHPQIIELISRQIGVNPDSIVDFEMLLYDTQKSCLGGLEEELIFSPRLDNLNMTYCSIMGLTQSVSSSSLEDESAIRLMACFDHEECGSKSVQGAASTLLPSIIQRLSVIPGFCSDSSAGPGTWDPTTVQRTLSTSFLISADMAHAVHPNYLQKYEANHLPQINQGTVIKINAKQLYATSSYGVVLLQEVAERAETPLQLFVVRNDSPCGSTIGPMLSAALGVRTIDVGNPQLSMHSIRETGGVYDLDHSIRLFTYFLESYSKLRVMLVDV